LLARPLTDLILFQKQLDPIELAADLRLSNATAAPSVSSAQRFKPRRRSRRSGA